MNLQYKHTLPSHFHSTSRVWIYQASRAFSLEETLKIDELLTSFAKNWKSHGTPVKGFGTILFNQFLVLMADEEATGVSGCSTDSSVHLMKEIGEVFQVNLFNRQQLAFVINDKIQLIYLNQLQSAADEGLINNNTLYFNNTVLIYKEFAENWLVPVSESWLQQRINFKSPALSANK